MARQESVETVLRNEKSVVGRICKKIGFNPGVEE